MRARTLVALLFATPALLLAQSASNSHSAAMKSKTLTPAQIHASALVIDSHADTPQRFLDEHYDVTEPLKGGEWNLETARKGNLGAQFFAIWVEPNQYKGEYAHRTLELIDAVKQQVARHPDRIDAGDVA